MIANAVVNLVRRVVRFYASPEFVVTKFNADWRTADNCVALSVSDAPAATVSNTAETGNTSHPNWASVEEVEDNNLDSHGDVDTLEDAGDSDMDHEDQDLSEGESFDDDYDSEEGDDDGAPPREVEEEEIELANAKIKVKVFLQDDLPAFNKWMHTIIVKCRAEDTDIGTGIGRYVRRGFITPNFRRDMDRPCQELSSIAYEIFDRYGRLRQEFKNHAVLKGTGVFGNELDDGDLFVVEYMFIQPEWRRKGLGTKIMETLTNKACTRGRSPSFTLVIPGWLRTDVGKRCDGKTEKEKRAIRDIACENAIAFYRSLKFRRIGLSGCFAVPADLTHKAYTLLASEDLDPAEPEHDSEDDEEDENKDTWSPFSEDNNREKKRLEFLQQRMPLHHATVTMTDSDCVKFFAKFDGADDEWMKKDRFHQNVLHLAACKLKPLSVNWLLKNVDTNKRLSSARTLKGLTPLEQLQDELETKRTQAEMGVRTVDNSDNFTGFVPGAVSCLAALKKTENNEKIDAIGHLRLKYGCTCGQCVGGFLSPRMKFALLCQAEITHDTLQMDIEDGFHWCDWNGCVTVHLPPHVQQNLRTNKSMRQGFANIFDFAAQALRSDNVPASENIIKIWRNASEWPPVTKAFFERGGNVESAVRIMFEHMKDQDGLIGDGEHEAVFGDQIDALPHCRNDHEFAFAALACGLPDLSPENEFINPLMDMLMM
jgi:GNAT superfamily N-acetyltransferase